MIVLKNVEKTYLTKSKYKVEAVKKVNLTFDKNEMIFILGQSGSGKTTLLNLLGGLDSETSGDIIVDGKKLGEEFSLESYRQNYVGFVFQEYNLINNLNVFDNIALALSTTEIKLRNNAIKKSLEKVGLKGYEKRKINELSGGQKQRIAIARALAKNSQILLCDEPTGNLDSKTSKEIFELLKELSNEKTVIIVSHNEESARQFADRIITITDGEITETNKVSKVQIDADEINKKEIINNSVPFTYIFKLSIKNLLSHKFKTIISFVLLFLSILSVSCMQICLNYNSEQAIADTLTNEKTVIVFHNADEQQEMIYNNEKYPINVSAISLEESNYRKIYSTTIGRINGCSNNDLELFGKQFYFKNQLNDGCVYVTDYFVEQILNSGNNYEPLVFNNYDELNNVVIKYDNKPLYKIAGVIKTDYKDFISKNNLEIVSNKIDTNNVDAKIQYEYQYRNNYIYNIIYMTENTFNSCDVFPTYNQFTCNFGYASSITTNNNTLALESIIVHNIDKEGITYFDSTNMLKTNNNQEANSYTTYEQSQNGIVISSDLYNLLFKKNIDWKVFYNEYINAKTNGLGWNNPLSDLNTITDIVIKDKNDNTIINLSNKNIIGVMYDNNYNSLRYQSSVFLSNETENIKNTDIIKTGVAEINWVAVKNKKEFLETLRENDHFIEGSIAQSCYEKEYIVKNMGFFFIAIASLFALITIFAMLNMVNTKIKDNTRQIGILMGIGFKMKNIFAIYMLSIIYLLVLAFLIITPINYALVYIVNNILLITNQGLIKFFSVSIETYFVILIISFMLLFFSAIPLISFTKKKPIEVINDNR